MEIDFNKIIEMFGPEVMESIKEEKMSLMNNIRYLNSLGITCSDSLLEAYPYSFIQDETEFKRKVNLLISTLGIDYDEELNNNIGLWSDVDE